MTGPRLGMGMPTNDGWIARELENLRRELRELRAARTLDSSTISPNGTLTVDGTLDVTGNLNVSGTSSLGGTLTIDGVEESSNYAAGASGFKIDGTTGNIELNNVTIRGGIIGNDALANPVEFDSDNQGTSTGVTFAASYAVAKTATVTVPSGFSQAFLQILGLARIDASSGGGALQTKISVSGHDSVEVLNAGTGIVMMNPTPFNILLTGLSAGSLTINLMAESTGAVAGTGGAYISVGATFLR